MTKIVLSLALLALSSAVNADHHASAEAEAAVEAQAEALANAGRVEAEARAQAEAQRVEAEAYKTEWQARREEIRRREAELAELARELSTNSLALAELTESLDPSIQERIRTAMVIADRPVLGINTGSAARPGEPVRGVTVSGVTPGWPADVAGVLSGDLITAIDGVSLAAPSPNAAEKRLLKALDELAPDTAVRLDIARNGKSLSFDIAPRQRLEMANASAFVVHNASPVATQAFEFSFDPFLSLAPHPWDGIELVAVTPALGRYFATDSGLLVVGMPSGIGIDVEEGDVIVAIDGREPTSVEHGMRILMSYEAGEAMTLALMRDRKRRELVVTVPSAAAGGGR
ncbi:MAG: PDZ domain-containing protein [Pseudomonadota bacterium]